MNLGAVPQLEPTEVFACLAWTAVCAVAWRFSAASMPGRLRVLLAAASGCLAASFLVGWLESFVAAEEQLFLRGTELTLLAVAWLMLAEFGRRHLAASAQAKVKARWLLLLPALAALIGALGVQAVVEEPLIDDYVSGFAAALCYVVGMPAALLAAAAFARTSHPVSPTARRGLMLAAFGMLGCGLINLLLPPPAAFFPADWLNREAFFFAVGVPDAWLLGLCGCAVASGMWLVRCGQLWLVRFGQQPVQGTSGRKILHQIALPAGLAVLAVAALALGTAQNQDSNGDTTLQLTAQAQSPMGNADFSPAQQSTRPDKLASLKSPSQSAGAAAKLADLTDAMADEAASVPLQAAAPGDRLKMGLPLLIILFLLTGVLCGLGAWASHLHQPSKQLRRRKRSTDSDATEGTADRRATEVVLQSSIK